MPPLKRKPIDFEINENGCFVCTSHATNKGNGKGYPRIRVGGGKSKVIHRYIFEECFGALDDDQVVMHKCDNTRCINPEHLQSGTQKQNVEDMVLKDRQNKPKGGKHPQTKLNDEIVKKIKIDFLNGLSVKDAVEKYSITKSISEKIKYGYAWNHVEI